MRGNLEQTGRYYRPGIPELPRRIDEVMEQFGLKEYEHHLPEALSGGYKRRLTTQVRLEHVVWGEALWAATLSTLYAAMVCVVLAGFGLFGSLTLQWAWLLAALPLLFLAALAFSAIGLLFTATLPSMDHMGLPFFLVIMPVGFASNTYFPLPDLPLLNQISLANPLFHLCEGLRWLLITGRIHWHLAAAAGLCLLMLAALIPLDMRLLRRRVFGDR